MLFIIEVLEIRTVQEIYVSGPTAKKSNNIFHKLLRNGNHQMVMHDCYPWHIFP